MGERYDASDAELLQRAKDGDALAFERFVRIHDPVVRALTARLLDGPWAEDVLQETYLKAYRALPAVRTDTSRLAGWLYRIAYRTAVDELRRIKRRNDRPRPAVVRLQIKSTRAGKPGHPMVREAALCATHARQLRNLGLELVSS